MHKSRYDSTIKCIERRYNIYILLFMNTTDEKYMSHIESHTSD